MVVQSLSGSWKFRQAGLDQWYPASVPGSVHLDLLNANLIPDPFVSDNEEKVQWVPREAWEYCLQFDANPSVVDNQRQYLVFDGIDTLATVELNGQLLGSCDNMYRTYEWEVSTLLKQSGNQLVLKFPSLGDYLDSKLAERRVPGVGFHGLEGGYYIRKAPCQFGWDWGPALPPIGIWKDVRIEGRTDGRLQDVHIRQYHHDGHVALMADVDAVLWHDANAAVKMQITAPDGTRQETTQQLTGAHSTLELKINNPELWFPNGYGNQPLYQVTVILLNGKDVVDEKSYQVGLRTLDLCQKPDEWGKSFTFVVNGIPVFAKGSNWIPADSFPTRISRERMEQWIRDTALANQNMLRVWGGGFYETEDFYDLCDKYGILVWQDCIFACQIYPLHQKEFVESIHHEIVDNARRLRHRASLALWCGNNEMEWGWEDWNWNNSANSDLKTGYDTFFHYLLPQWLKELDPDTTYWPSSPSSDTPFFNTNGQKQGDSHYWDVWHKGAPFTEYRNQYPRFMSEFGFQSFPPIETINQYAAKEDQNLTSYVMELHQKNNNGNRFIINQMTASFQIPSSFEKLMYMSMVLQAEGIRFGVEHWRRNKNRVSGTLYWQCNDCWPVASWASLDYFGRWKALHYSAKRFYAPVLLSLFDEGTHIGIHLTSDLTADWQGEIKWRLETLNGKVLEQGSKQAMIPALLSHEIIAVDLPVPAESKRECVFVAELWQGSDLISTQIAPFVPNKHLKLQNPRLSVNVSENSDQLLFAINAKSLARYVELKLAGADVVFSDNYFDLPAHQTRVITCQLPAGWSVEDAKSKLQVMHLFSSYAE